MPPNAEPRVAEAELILERCPLIETDSYVAKAASTASSPVTANSSTRVRCAILGCGMMGQEHISYMLGYSSDVEIAYLCDPHLPSLRKSMQVFEEYTGRSDSSKPSLLSSEAELLQQADDIDVLVIATPNYLHADTILRWRTYDVTILVEKPVAVSLEQHSRLIQAMEDSETFTARVWVMMEYRYMPAIAKLASLIPSVVGDIKMITIRENRYPFLHKIDAWNRDPSKTGDSLVEKCVHFFDLFRYLTRREPQLDQIRSLAQRGINYTDEEPSPTPIVDAAYVTLPFRDAGISNGPDGCSKHQAMTLACLELCMYAEGSRHQEEIVVTGTKGRLEAYLPENKVYSFVRPSEKQWADRSVPPPPESIVRAVYDCDDIRQVHGLSQDTLLPTHGGYHYSSTAIEWYHVLSAISNHQKTGIWVPHVSLDDGLRAVEMGLRATQSIANESQ
jgi:myo-inositol 2-dehydrogenase / D-chiro-inositol 1-dehydrogenase